MLQTVDEIGRMPPFGVVHLLMLALTTVLMVAAPMIVRRVRDQTKVDRFVTRAGWIMLVVSVLWFAWQMLPDVYDVNHSLPFHYSDVLRIVTPLALITRSGCAVAVSYFWGLTLNLQAVLTPDLGYYRDIGLEFTMFWVLHSATLIAATVLVWGLGYQPTWAGYGAAFALSVGWAGIALVVNHFTGANYGYLSAPPDLPSLIDVLGPWPIYLVYEAALIAAIWALMTWPWTRREILDRSHSEDRLGLTRRRITRTHLALRF